ncbi:MAG: outer membrane lipoprotein SlyB [Sodalis sp. Fle]|nr:MAG: outer membrane lipoprotein SlyB [Sodalis sp. Fle]
MIERLIMVVLLMGTMLVGCTNNSTLFDDVYSASQAKQVQSMTYGTLVGVRPVQIQGGEDSNVIGALSGAVLGGLLGNTVGGGTGRNLTTVAGTMAGGMVGSNVENMINRIHGVEMEIRKDDGNTVMVVQKQGNTHFSVGQRVLLISNSRSITVSPR